MGRLSKREIKKQQPLLALIQSSTTFTTEELDLIYEEFNEQMLITDITSSSSFYTPYGLAFDHLLMSPIADGDTIIDLCAGIGVLSYAASWRYENLTQIAIEFNRTANEAGKRMLPWVDWYHGSIFDPNIWEEIEEKYDHVDTAISNPPFGRTTEIDNRELLRYTGSDFEIAAIDLALSKAENNSFIIPQGSVNFRKSCEPFRELTHLENRKLNKLWKDIGQEYYCGWNSIDTRVYGEFRNTKITTESVSFYLD